MSGEYPASTNYELEPTPCSHVRKYNATGYLSSVNRSEVTHWPRVLSHQPCVCKIFSINTDLKNRFPLYSPADARGAVNADD